MKGICLNCDGFETFQNTPSTSITEQNKLQ